MKTLLLSMASIAAITLLTGCGTVSNVTATPVGKNYDLRKYEKAVVLDFADGASKAKDGERGKAEMIIRGKSFADRIAVELNLMHAFKEVTRADSIDRIAVSDSETLVISGIITRYVAGDAVTRYLVGLGAGSSYFDALVDFRDGANSELLATQKIDKNSWVMGGGIAATQTPETFMFEAARKLADDITFAKQTGQLLGKEKRQAAAGTQPKY